MIVLWLVSNETVYTPSSLYLDKVLCEAISESFSLGLLPWTKVAHPNILTRLQYDLSLVCFEKKKRNSCSRCTSFGTNHMSNYTLPIPSTYTNPLSHFPGEPTHKRFSLLGKGLCSAVLEQFLLYPVTLNLTYCRAPPLWRYWTLF